MWLYYYYCRFLLQTLKEFEQLVQGLDDSNEYNRRYQGNIALFDNVRNAFQNERPFLDMHGVISQTAVDELLADMYSVAVRLGAEWQQAVYSAAQDLKL